MLLYRSVPPQKIKYKIQLKKKIWFVDVFPGFLLPLGDIFRCHFQVLWLNLCLSRSFLKRHLGGWKIWRCRLLLSPAWWLEKKILRLVKCKYYCSTWWFLVTYTSTTLQETNISLGKRKIRHILKSALDRGSLEGRDPFLTEPSRRLGKERCCSGPPAPFHSIRK